MKVYAPENLNIPFLCSKLNGRTIQPTGRFSGWYFSEELKLAQKLGYKIKILEAILYERGKPFNDYVNNLFAMRKKYPKGTAMNTIVKLLLNSLYGVFGMNNIQTNYSLLNKNTESFIRITKNIKENLNIKDLIQFNEKILVGREVIMNDWDRIAISKKDAIQKCAELFQIPVNEIKLILKLDRKSSLKLN